MECDWPGNVRELENVMERAVVLAPDEGRITEELLPREVLDSRSMDLGSLSSLENGATLKNLVLEYEKKLIMTALQKADWSQKKAAKLLRMNRSTLNVEQEPALSWMLCALAGIMHKLSTAVS